MKTLADEVLALVGPNGVSLIEAAKALVADKPSVRAAFLKLDAEGKAIAARSRGQGRAWRLLSLGDKTPVCKICHREFERPRKSKRATCSRECWASFGWHNPEGKQKRIAAIKRQRASAEGRANTAARNKTLWSDPKQRERLAEWSRKRWSDPEVKAKMSAAIHAVQSKPEMRARYSEIRKAQWKDPVIRERMHEAAKKSQKTQAYREKLRKLVKERWKDPYFREKWTKANAARNTPDLRKAASERMKARHKAKREARP
jgi:hypothetical protein